MTTRGCSGVQADRASSYSKLEVAAAHVRRCLGVSSEQAIDPLQLFEDLHEISLNRANRESLPLSYGVVALENSEGYTRYDRIRNVMEIIASEQTYEWLEDGHPRGAYFVAHELGHLRTAHGATCSLGQTANKPTSCFPPWAAEPQGVLRY